MRFCPVCVVNKSAKLGANVLFGAWAGMKKTMAAAPGHVGHPPVSSLALGGLAALKEVGTLRTWHRAGMWAGSVRM